MANFIKVKVTGGYEYRINLDHIVSYVVAYGSFNEIECHIKLIDGSTLIADEQVTAELDGIFGIVTTGIDAN